MTNEMPYTHFIIAQAFLTLLALIYAEVWKPRTNRKNNRANLESKLLHHVRDLLVCSGLIGERIVKEGGRADLVYVGLIKRIENYQGIKTVTIKMLEFKASIPEFKLDFEISTIHGDILIHAIYHRTWWVSVEAMPIYKWYTYKWYIFRQWLPCHKKNDHYLELKKKCTSVRSYTRRDFNGREMNDIWDEETTMLCHRSKCCCIIQLEGKAHRE